MQFSEIICRDVILFGYGGDCLFKYSYLCGMKQMSEIEKLRMQIYVLEGQNAFNKEYLAYLHNMISSMQSDNEESKPFERRRFPGLYDGLAQVLEFEDDEDYEDDDSL